MKSTYLIFAAAGFCSLLPTLPAADNYSLWPRRPAELEQARLLVREQKHEDAVALLTPFISARGVAGREARQIISAINIPRYLSQQHPHARLHKVERGDTLERIAASSHCPSDVIMMLNGMVEPSSLKVGQKLVILDMRLRMVIYPDLQEITVWDGEQLVAAYSFASIEGISLAADAETTLVEREGSIGGKVISRRSAYYPASDRMLLLGNGLRIAGKQQPGGDKVLRMEQRELNELAMLLAGGARVHIRRGEIAPASAAAAP